MKLKLFFALLILSVTTLCRAQLPYVKAREHINLTNWTFIKGIFNSAQKTSFDIQNCKEVRVPHTYSMDAINEVGYYRGQAWYRTEVQIPESMKGKRIFIRFEGVGQEAKVYVNEKKVGSHVGGYSAFCYEITDALKVDAKNLIAVNVTNEPNFKRIPVDDKLFNHYGGIFRPVQIFSTPRCNITPTFYASSGVFVELKNSTSDEANVEVRTHISNTSDAKSAKLKYKIFDAEKKLVLDTEKQIDQLNNNATIAESFKIEKPVLWNGRKNPYLYTIEVELLCGESSDKVQQTFGLRTYKVDADKGFFLNGEPYRIYGVATHQEWKNCGPALLPKNHRRDLELIDEIGATGVRFSHYQHSDIKYQLADSIGLLIWSEIPFVHSYSGREGGCAKQLLTELIYQNYNHPSIFVWGLWNEVRAWKGKDEPCVVLTKELNKLAHKLDATRLTTSASDRGMVSNMGNISDLQSWNKYFGWYYGEYEDMAKWLDDSHKNYPDIELGISEYGVGGNIYQQDVTKLEKPSGNYFPEPVQSVYHEVTWKIIKDRPFLWSTFVWNMFDFSVAGWNRGGISNLNHKGLVSYDRKVKKDAFYFYKANWSDKPVLHIAEMRNNKRTDARTQVKVYTNLPKVTLTLNGKKVGTQKQSGDLNIIVFESINLIPGNNTIEVSTKNGKENLMQKVTWELSQK